MSALESRNARLRLSVLGAVAFALFTALFARVWFLQVMSEEQFVELAEGNKTREIVELAPRGRILDVTGRVLVDNRPSIVITIDKETIAKNVSDDDLDDLFFDLANEISASGKLTKVSQIEEAYASDRYGPFAEVPVVRDVSEELQLYLAERSHRFPGVNSQVVLVRTYPYGELAAHLLGYVGSLSEAEAEALEDSPLDYQANDEIGKSGVELFYESSLRGTPGFRVVEVDRFNNVVAVKENIEPIAGNDVHLTIDIDIQALAEQELEAGLERARRQDAASFAREGEEPPEFTAPAGAIVIMDPQNGDVRAMASYPSYDPELFVNGISAPDFAALRDDEDIPLLNRAIQGEYAPGSTFKPFTTYAAIDTGLIGSRGILDIRTMYADAGIYQIPGCTTDDCFFQNAGAAVLGPVDLRLALTLSSDTYYYNLAANFDRLSFDTDSIQQAAELFGFGQATGITLPAESSGYIPTPERRRALHEENPEAFPFPDWTTGDTLNTSIGQGDVLATPLQIANAYSVIANGGTLYAPNLGKRVVDPITGEELLSFGERVVRDLYWPDLIRDPIWDGLRDVTTYLDEGAPGGEERSGTGRPAFEGFPHSQWPVGGKTGTSEKFGADADFALFAGYGPLTNPEYVAVVVLEEAGFGGNVAAPVVRSIFELIALDDVPEHLTQAEQDERDALIASLFEQGFEEDDILAFVNGEAPLPDRDGDGSEGDGGVDQALDEEAAG